MQIKVINFFIVLVISCNIGYSQSPYKSNQELDITLVSSAVVVSILDLYLIDQKKPLTIQELELVNSENINSFDKSAIENYSENSFLISDILLIASSLSPILMIGTSRIRDDIEVYARMYLQTAFLSYAVPHLAKATIDRYRPYVYNQNVPLEQKLTTDSKLSFFSGHATFSFANAVFSSKTYSDYYPESDWKAVIWSANLLLASTVSYLRYSSGAHFPTDILTGAIVGSLIGYLIPVIHKNDEQNPILNEPEPYQNLFTFRFNIN